MTIQTAVIANLLVLGWAGYALVLNAYSPDLYYLSVQEDEYLEWGTFWAFMGAAFLQARIAWTAWGTTATGRNRPPGLAWFWAGLALFCAVVAMEEISWGQRLIGYRPPEYFLRENFQQEPNLHNVFDTALRKLALQCVIGGYGIVLPWALMFPGLGPALRRIGVAGPSPWLIPAFAGTLYLYVTYPWSYTGEVVELMLGLAFLFAALGVRAPQAPLRVWAPVVACSVVMALGTATAAAGRLRRSHDNAYAKLAQSETEALRFDFLSQSQPSRNRYATKCDLHKRVYTYAEKYRAKFLARGRFAELVEEGLPEERVEYFIDPWNVPYWIRDNCDDDTGERSIFVYSFGPNRKRDSTRQILGGDDVGNYIRRPESLDN